MVVGYGGSKVAKPGMDPETYPERSSEISSKVGKESMAAKINRDGEAEVARGALPN